MNPQADLEPRLLCVLGDIERQDSVAATYSPDALPFREEMAQIREYIEVAGEYEIAYETLVAALEKHPFVLEAKAVISLLECALLLGFKTSREEDQSFNRR